MRCGDCKHWKQAAIEVVDDADIPHETSDVLTDLGFCMAVDGPAVCASPDSYGPQPLLRQRDLDDIGTRRAIPCDGSGYRAALLTRDNFGCVLFEQKAGAEHVQRTSPDDDAR